MRCVKWAMIGQAWLWVWVLMGSLSGISGWAIEDPDEKAERTSRRFTMMMRTPFADTWVFDLAVDRWQHLKSAVHPPARSEHIAVLDGGRHLASEGGGQTIRRNDQPTENARPKRGWQSRDADSEIGSPR